MTRLPREKTLDSTRALLREGYTFIGRRMRRLGSDAFRTRLMGRSAVCVAGAEAARMFYAPDRFTRKGALPPTALMLLQDYGSVQLRDGPAHRHRKAMFLSLMHPDGIQPLVARFRNEWRAALARWEGMDHVVLHGAVQEVLCRAVCAWAGVPLADDEARRRTREFAAMIDGAGSAGPRNWRGMLLRARTERWARGIVAAVRDGSLPVPAGSAAQVIARHREPDGEPLSARHAAVELINVLRPTVAVARYITFCAHALHARPDCAARVRAGEDGYARCFVQEVRRFYPFFPAVGGRALREFEWRGQRFCPGTWVLLDLYGTNRDPRSWDRPEAFHPERFAGRKVDAFSLVPQGGGDHAHGHRCPGEWITIALMGEATRLLAGAMRYDVPPQDLRIPLSRLPAIPASGLVMTNVRRA